MTTKKQTTKPRGNAGGSARGKATQAKPAPLNPRQLRFIDEYLVDLNGTHAAIRAGYSRNGADVQAVRLLGDARIAAAIEEGRRRLAERTQISAERVLQEVSRLAFLDIRRAFDEDGNLKPMAELDDDTAAAIAGLEVLEEYQGRGQDREYLGRTKKIKLSDKKGALELLMRHLGLLNDKLKLGGDPENPLTMLLQQVEGTALKPRATNPPSQE